MSTNTLEEDKFRVVVTAIIKRSDGRMLITKRHPDKKRWPGKWTVPGGNLTTADFLGTPTAINNQWYGVIENAVRREVLEETGLKISGVEYLCSIAVQDAIIISCIAYPIDEKAPIVLQTNEAVEYAWVNPIEALEYDLIDGLQQELEETI